MHTKSAVAITLLMVSSLACACGEAFFAPQGPAPQIRAHTIPKVLDNDKSATDDLAVRRFLTIARKMKKAELLALLNTSGAKLLGN